ncbi:uncharacterized protein LOC124161857 [Ischnura elegans]|uniref:uncharacterized protein LOC124161857 n=1 Tax=Ischnura elegans TaxID=197161 RepID=UPI001ED8A7D8|nr:uncharacterized protein LOC124161857 [Ischnura elegans]
MGILRRTAIYATMTLLVMSMLMEEVDARRKILLGRKAITRTYNKGTAIPAWGIVLMVSAGIIALGVILYFVLRKIILKDDDTDEP